MADLEARLTILEALVSRLLQEIRVHDIPARPPPLTTWEQVGPSSAPTIAVPTIDPETGNEVWTGPPQPHPDWLAVVHANGPAACHQPGLFLTQRVSGVHIARREHVRILPRQRDPETGIWISEPFRAPISSDLVVCQSCAHPIDIWTARDLDYRPYLDNEIGQPMHPRFTDDERLAQLKEQASQLREQVRAP